MRPTDQIALTLQKEAGDCQVHARSNDCIKSITVSLTLQEPQHPTTRATTMEIERTSGQVDLSCMLPGVEENETVADGPLPGEESSAALLTSPESMDVAPQPAVQVTVTPPENVPDKRQQYDIKVAPRGYQTRLATPGIRGENYIICLPTGTGKTLIASIVIAEHLKCRAQSGGGKVLFIVPTKQLAFQQKEKLNEYIHGIGVAVVVGRSDSETFIHPLLPGIDAVVCTPGKLRPELYLKKLKMSDFSLVILDECHHAVRPASPYGDVMEFYLMEKSDRTSSAQLPQVVGMTASPGAGKSRSPTLEKAIEHQTMLCARVDATSGFKTDHSDELQQHTGNPERISHILEKREREDPFIECVISAMSQLEAMLHGGAPRWRHVDRRYKQWIEQEISAAQLRHEDQRDQLTILGHLLECHIAIITYEDFRFQDAMKIIVGIKAIQQDKATSIQLYLNSIMNDLCCKLRRLDVRPNPVLCEVEDKLCSQFELDPGSKGIFFVREIRHTQIVSNWVNSSPKLKRLIKASPITGHTKAGMPDTEQKRVIEAFRAGRYNLLVSTSVLHEGIDVVECNLVVHFQYIPDEIAEVQARGRARAKDSKIYTLLTTSEPWQCRKLLQKVKEELSNRALQQLVNHGISSEIPNIQQEIVRKRYKRLQEAEKHKKRWDPNEVEILCNSCKVFVCRGIDVFTYGPGPDFHYVLPDADFDDSQKKPCDNSDTRYGAVKLYDIECTKCPNQKWGDISQWKDGPTLVLLKCRAFTFRYKRRETETFKQWKRVPFHIQHYGDELCEQDTYTEPLDISS